MPAKERVFHGVNAVVKGPPWRPSTDGFNVDSSLVDEDFALLQKAGVTVIRLGLMWAGVEPTRGVYDAGYVSEMVALARKAADYGIYTLLDMHQDVMSEKFCGEGFPAWAAQPSGSLAFPEPAGFAFTNDAKSGIPSAGDCEKHAWSQFYFSEAASTAFQALYDNKDGLLDSWAAMWAHVAGAFKGESHILGAELINEPWAGDVIHRPTLLLPKIADLKNFQPAYDKLAAALQAIWAVDPERLVFFAGITWDDRGSGFTHAPGGAEVAARSVYCYHYYEYPSGPQVANTSAYHVTTQTAEAIRLGTGAMLTEFGEYGFMDDKGVFQAVTGIGKLQAEK
ncbi:glycoside hydrolase superfamily [Baffinella frigidus]|nr:glycoside hydrolase superfamily [Cryptophyta sp. CCMP2293]